MDEKKKENKSVMLKLKSELDSLICLAGPLVVEDTWDKL